MFCLVNFFDFCNCMFILNLVSTTFLEQVGTGATKDGEMKPEKKKLDLYCFFDQ